MADTVDFVIPSELRRELIEYYKWIVSLATFVLTVSLSLTAAVQPVAASRWCLLAGWFLLGACIFSNWLIIKSMLSIAVTGVSAPESWSKAHFLMLDGALTRQKVYGNVQNATFLLGVVCLLVGHIASVWS